MMEEMFPIYPLLEIRADPSNPKADTPVIMSIPNLCINCMGVYWFYPTCNKCGDTCCPFSSCVRHWTDHGCFQNCTCKLCEKTFASEEHYQQHIATHKVHSTLPATESCTESRKQNSNNKVEVLKQQSYSCRYCEKIFPTKSSLHIHSRIHSDERPFLCNNCGRRFSRKCHLAQHIQTHTGEKPFICEDCGKRFLRKSHLHTHNLIHTGEKPYICNVCNKCFRLKHHLFAHKLIHTGEKSCL